MRAAKSSPVITSQPTNETLKVGRTATFSVTAIGTGPLSYQWRFGSTNVVGATNAALTLSNVLLNQAGNYSVSVTNLFGSTNSHNALLTVYAQDHFAWSNIQVAALCECALRDHDPGAGCIQQPGHQFHRHGGFEFHQRNSGQSAGFGEPHSGVFGLAASRSRNRPRTWYCGRMTDWANLAWPIRSI